MKISENLKKRFVKDCSLPISCLEDPYFQYYLDTWHYLFNTKYKWQMYLELLSQFETEERFDAFFYSVRDSLVEKVKSTKEYQTFIADKEWYDSLNTRFRFSTKDIYKMPNVGKWFVSIDLTKANFNALRHYSPAIFDDAESWNDFVYDHLTENYPDVKKYEHISSSKYLRQYVFGHLNPKRQINFCKHLINGIIDKLLEKYDGTMIVSNNHDEVLLETTEAEYATLKAECEALMASAFPNLQVDVEAFKLANIDNRKLFMKEHDNGEVEFKCVPTQLFPQVFKFYYGKELKENDLVFMHDGIRCKYDQNVFNNKRK